MTHTSPFKDLRGRLKQNAPLHTRSWFRTGGPADWLFVPKDTDDLSTLLRQRPETMPLTILGACSNVIIRDGGIEGIIIRMAGGFAHITHDEETGIIAGAAALDSTVSDYAAHHNITGLEFLSSIPGSIGGAIRMNAGAYGTDIASVLDWVDILTQHGNTQRLPASELSMSYRTTILPHNSIVIRARLKGKKGLKKHITETMQSIRIARENSQPLRARTGGSTFRNPESHKAWQLIDHAGCRGMRIGDAQMSEKHCNFMLNLGNASSSDLETLGEAVRERVLKHSGVTLHWEIKRIGRLSTSH